MGDAHQAVPYRRCPGHASSLLHGAAIVVTHPDADRPRRAITNRPVVSPATGRPGLDGCPKGQFEGSAGAKGAGACIGIREHVRHEKRDAWVHRLHYSGRLPGVQHSAIHVGDALDQVGGNALPIGR